MDIKLCIICMLIFCASCVDVDVDVDVYVYVEVEVKSDVEVVKYDLWEDLGLRAHSAFQTALKPLLTKIGI